MHPLNIVPPQRPFLFSIFWGVFFLFFFVFRFLFSFSLFPRGNQPNGQRGREKKKENRSKLTQIPGRESAFASAGFTGTAISPWFQIVTVLLVVNLSVERELKHWDSVSDCLAVKLMKWSWGSLKERIWSRKIYEFVRMGWVPGLWSYFGDLVVNCSRGCIEDLLSVVFGMNSRLPSMGTILERRSGFLQASSWENSWLWVRGAVRCWERTLWKMLTWTSSPWTSDMLVNSLLSRLVGRISAEIVWCELKVLFFGISIYERVNFGQGLRFISWIPSRFHRTPIWESATLLLPGSHYVSRWNGQK